MLDPGVDVGAALDEQLDHVHREKLRSRGVLKRSAPGWIEGIDIGAAVEQHADRAGIGERRDALQRAREVALSRIRLENQVHAFRTVLRQRHGQRHAAGAGGFEFGATAHQQLHAIGVGGQRRLNERRGFPGGIRGGIRFGAAIEQQLDQGDVARPARRNHQRRSRVIRLRVDIRAMSQQNAGLFDIGRGPHQRRRLGVIASIGVGALLQQLLQKRGVAIESGVHERRGSFRPARIEELGVLRHKLQERLAVAGAQRIHHRHGFGVQRRQIRLIGQRVGPLGALVDPGLDDSDLFRLQRPGGRHLRTEFVAGHAVIEDAVGAAARHHAAETRLKSGASAVESQAVHLLRGSVTANAVLPE